MELHKIAEQVSFQQNTAGTRRRYDEQGRCLGSQQRLAFSEPWKGLRKAESLLHRTGIPMVSKRDLERDWCLLVLV